MGRDVNSSVLRLHMFICKTPPSKINQLNINLFVNGNVLCLDVAVADTPLVTITYYSGELNESTGPYNGTKYIYIFLTGIHSMQG